MSVLETSADSGQRFHGHRDGQYLKKKGKHVFSEKNYVFYVFT